MICSHAYAPLSTHTLAWRRKHDDGWAALRAHGRDLGRDGDFSRPVQRKSVGESRFLNAMKSTKSFEEPCNRHGWPQKVAEKSTYRFEIARCRILPVLAGHVREPAGESFNLSAIRAKSGKEEAFIFRMT